MKKLGFKGLASLLLCLSVVLSLCGCGSGSSSDMAAASVGYNSKQAMYADDVYTESAYAEEYDSYPENGDAGTGEPVEVKDTGRKLIKNASISAETDDMDVFLNKLEARINALGGYLEYSNVYNGSYGSRESRYANLTARIPAQKLDEFLNNVAEYSNVTSKNMSVNDVTLQYADNEARKSSLKTEQARLLELMEEAQSVDEIIYIESRLTDVRYELESIERQLRTYDNQVDYSTVSIDATEVVKYTPLEEPSRWQKISEGFMESLADVWEGILDFITDFIIAIPVLTLLGLIGLIIFLIVILNVKRSRKKKAKLLAKKQAELEAQQAKNQQEAVKQE